MKVFWVIVGSAILLAFFAVSVEMKLLAQTPRSEHMSSPAIVVARLLATSSLVAIVWAIIFRRQLERRQFSLAALGALVAMEAVLYGAIRIIGTLGP